MKTITVIKMEYRELGKGWSMTNTLDKERLDLFIVENNIQEYVVYEVNEVALDLSHVKTLFKGVKYHYVKGKQIGSSEYDCVEIDELDESKALHIENANIENTKQKAKNLHLKKINTS